LQADAAYLYNVLDISTLFVQFWYPSHGYTGHTRNNINVRKTLKAFLNFPEISARAIAPSALSIAVARRTMFISYSIIYSQIAGRHSMSNGRLRSS